MHTHTQTHTHTQSYICFIYSCLSVSATILPLCDYLCSGFPALLLIIIMYIYHALINTLSVHVIHINLNMIFYTHVEHSPTKTICIKYYTPPPPKKKHYSITINTHTHIDCSRNWVLILVRMEILWEEEGFQFGFKRWQGWAVSKVLREWIPNVGSKAQEGMKAMSLVFVLLDLQHAGVRRRA